MTQAKGHQYLLASILTNPQRSCGLPTRDWENLIWQARSAELIAQLRFVLNEAGLLAKAPVEAVRHLDVAWTISQKHAQAVHWELKGLGEALGHLGLPVVLLKGAAYCAQSNSAAIGRLFNDIDILVPKNALPLVEVELRRAGWLPEHTNAYDERYYREWMHEIPPMEHKNRSTVLDVHHNIIAPTSGIRPDPQRLFSTSIALTGEFSCFRVLAREDMVIHSACHLFFGEFHKGLRDLFDLHRLLTEYSKDPRFWEHLFDRAEELRLTRSVSDAIRHCVRLFETDIPPKTISRFESRRSWFWKFFPRNWLFDQVLRPNHSSAANSVTRLAQWLAFARSHWLRMPLPLLAYHLSHKLVAKD